MTIKLPVDVNTLDDETLSLLIDESKKALDERKKYVPFVGEIIEVWGSDCCETYTGLAEFSNFDKDGKVVDECGLFWKYYRRLDPTHILQFRDHEPGPCPCPDNVKRAHLMFQDGTVETWLLDDLGEAWWKDETIIRWCPAVGVE